MIESVRRCVARVGHTGIGNARVFRDARVLFAAANARHRHGREAGRRAERNVSRSGVATARDARRAVCRGRVGQADAHADRSAARADRVRAFVTGRTVTVRGARASLRIAARVGSIATVGRTAARVLAIVELRVAVGGRSGSGAAARPHERRRNGTHSDDSQRCSHDVIMSRSTSAANLFYRAFATANTCASSTWLSRRAAASRRT